MSNVRPLKAGTPPAQVSASDVVTVNTIDAISATTLAIAPTTATEVDIANASATVKIKGNVDQSVVTNTNNSVDLGSVAHGWRDVYLWDGADGRALSDTTLGAPGAELVGVNATEFTTIAPGANNVLAAFKSVDDVLTAIEPPVLDDFDNSGSSWKVTTTNGATAQITATATPAGFPSRGVAILETITTSGSKVELLRNHSGYVLGATKPIVVTWRFFVFARPATGADTMTMLLGLQGSSTDALGLALIISGTSITSSLETFVGGVLTSESLTLPAGTYYNVRLTVSETGTTVEIAPDDGAYTTVLVGAVAPTHIPYAPWAHLDRTANNGAGTVVLDYVDVQGDRTALDSGVVLPTPDPFLVGFPGFGTSSTTACVGNDSRLSDSRNPLAHATSHKSGGSDPIKLNELAAPTAAVNLNSQQLVSVASGSTTVANGANIGDVVQPRAIVQAGSYTISALDSGQIIFATGGGAQGFNLNDQSASLISGRALVHTIEEESGSDVTITLGAGVTINGSSSAYNAAGGSKRIKLISRDGLAWIAKAQ